MNKPQVPAPDPARASAPQGVPPVAAPQAAQAAPQAAPPAPAQRVAAGQIPDTFPNFAAAPEEMARRTRMLADYVREHMTEGEDYGVVPGGNKPSLFKAGAEKLNAAFGLSPTVTVTNRLENWAEGLLSYEVKVTLTNKRTGNVEAEGIGSCNSRERRYKNHDAAGVANTLLKMAKKRALVDATLSATRASGLFTQDLEDLDLGSEGDHGHRGRSHAARPSPVVIPDNAPSAQPPGAQPTAAHAQVPGAGSDGLTEAQLRAILAIAGKIFRRETRDAELSALMGMPAEQLSKSEASLWIDRLRARLLELGDAPEPGAPGDRPARSS